MAEKTFKVRLEQGIVTMCFVELEVRAPNDAVAVSRAVALVKANAEAGTNLIGWEVERAEPTGEITAVVV